MLQISQFITVHSFHTLHAIAVYAVISVQKVKGQIHFSFPVFLFLHFFFLLFSFYPTLAHPKVATGRHTNLSYNYYYCYFGFEYCGI